MNPTISNAVEQRRSARLLCWVGSAIVAAALISACAGVEPPTPSPVADAPDEPFKLGTFEHEGRTFLGIVLRDTHVIDVAAASGVAAVDDPIPSTLLELVTRYEEPSLRQRIYAIVNGVVESGVDTDNVYALEDLTILPPVRPEHILNGALNFQEHADELQAAGPGVVPGVSESDLRQTREPVSQPPIPGVWTSAPGDTRQNPYLFMKPSSSVTASGQPIRLPPGRDRVDWECELNAVVGKPAYRVPVDRIDDYIFGYTLQNDVSDRAPRLDGRHGSDWLLAKGHDTFSPIGPFLVPKEFVVDPQRLSLRLTLNGEVMQDSNTELMVHTLAELTSFASHLLTLMPGDLISSGSPAGIGAARETPIFFKPGDITVCTVDSIGTLTNPVVSAVP